MTSVSGTQPG